MSTTTIPRTEPSKPASLGTGVLRLALPKGRMEQGVTQLLADAGIRLRATSRNYRPELSLAGFECKVLKPHDIVEMLHLGVRDIGFGGADWVRELGADLVDVLDTGLDPVRVVVAAPVELVGPGGTLPRRALRVASEYRVLTRGWIDARGCGDTAVFTRGATEVFPPDDADCIVDVTQSGATLAANGLAIVDEIMRSSTRLFASRSAWEDPARGSGIERFAMLLRSVLEARRRVMLELNVPADRLEDVVRVLPCMREPTVSTLHAGSGYAVKAAVPREKLAELIPQLKARGGSDIVVSSIGQIVP